MGHHPVNPKGIRCPRCNKAYDFWTKDGRLTGPFHPMGACKAPPTNLNVPVECAVCGEDVPDARPGYVGHDRARTCSPECRVVLDNRERAAVKQAVAARAARRAARKAEAAQADAAKWFADYKQRRKKA